MIVAGHVDHRVERHHPVDAAVGERQRREVTLHHAEPPTEPAGPVELRDGEVDADDLEPGAEQPRRHRLPRAAARVEHPAAGDDGADQVGEPREVGAVAGSGREVGVRDALVAVTDHAAPRVGHAAQSPRWPPGRAVPFGRPGGLGRDAPGTASR